MSFQRLSRRRLLGGAAAAAGMAAAPSRSRAAAGSVGFCSWGGPLQALQQQYVITPFSAESGITVTEDSLPLASRIKTMVDNKALEFDVVETDLLTQLSLEEMGDYFEPIDYSKLSAAALAGIPKHLQREKAVGYLYWSYNLGYRTDKFPGGLPKDWADVWNLEKFPGKRTLASADDGQYPSLEFALLADGVPMDKLYPIDVDRAFKSLDRIKPDIAKWWSSGSEVVQLYTSGAVTTGSTYSGELLNAKAAGAPVDLTWNQGQASLDYMMILKGAPMDRAMQLLDALLAAKPQTDIFNAYDAGPANTHVLAALQPGRAAGLPSYPANLSQMFVQDSKWWADNLDAVIKRFDEWTLV